MIQIGDKIVSRELFENHFVCHLEKCKGFCCVYGDAGAPLEEKETEQLELAAYYGLSERYANKGPVSYDASIDDARAGKTVSVYDIAEHTDSEYYKEATEEGISTILSIPLRFETEVIGVIRMYADELLGRGCSAKDHSNLINAAEGFRNYPIKKLPS